MTKTPGTCTINFLIAVINYIGNKLECFYISWQCQKTYLTVVPYKKDTSLVEFFLVRVGVTYNDKQSSLLRCVNNYCRKKAFQYRPQFSKILSLTKKCLSA